MDITGANTTSFIPKKPLVVRSDFTSSFSGIFLVFSILLFIASVGGYFLANYQLDAKTKDRDNIKANLIKAKDQFEPDQVINMTRFDTKLRVAQDLLYLNKNLDSGDFIMHITLRPLFKLISDNTLESVRFKDFKYSNIDNQKIEIKMSGEARGGVGTANYAAVAQQAREFADSRGLMNVIVSDLNLGANNNVIFNIAASVRPDLISYSESLKQ